MRVQSRLVLGFGVMLAVSVIIAGYGVFSIYRSPAQHGMYVLIALAGAGLLLGVITSVQIYRSVINRIQEAVSVLDELGRGNLNVNLRAEHEDEAEPLSRSMRNLAVTLQNLVSDMDKMSDEHERGDIDTSIDAKKYQGAYNIAAKKINTMVGSHIATKRRAMEVFDEFGNGNFDAQLEKMPLKKAFLNDSVDNMRTQLKQVIAEVEKMIEATVNGDLSKLIDERKYKGDWLKIMKGLNRLTQAVHLPISEINNVMSHLSKGDFDIKVVGSYKGDFLSIQESVNLTITSLSGYVKEMSQILIGVSRGDLTRSIKREYIGNFADIKNSINHIIETLYKTMSEITIASEHVHVGARQISESSMDLANGSTTQASSVEELNASMEQISQQTRNNAENASSANTLAGSAAVSAQKGNEAMQQMLEAMWQIRDSSKSISKIIKDIQDIAFQTNLLSVNAAVEAARAGENGRGFSVVAGEVRNLAIKSQKSATDTTEIIEDSMAKIEAGVEIAQNTANSLNEIVSQAGSVLSIVNGIATASTEQTNSIAEVSLGLEQISGVVQNTSAISQQGAAAAEELASQSEVLTELVSYFKLQ